jgi:REP element-mobilizing transposase RayT
MARSLRIERENGVYHVINRGNYRQDLFINEGAHASFEKCLFEACEKCGWILEAHCVMTNHFHLAIRTPHGNLVYGMKWLQSTFANRYHKYRKAHGKLFQGRYKSLIVEEDSYLGGLLQYIHLNPVRAGLCSVDELCEYRWSSYWYLNHPKLRPAFMDISGALDAAGGLKDTAHGRRKYRDYLRWLSEDRAEQKTLEFDKMCSGWALGTLEFKKDVLKSEGLLKDGDRQAVLLEGASLQEANELQWQALLERGLLAAEKDDAEIEESKKSSDWKIWIAYELKHRSSAPNPWIASKLNMGAAQAVSLHTSRFKPNEMKNNSNYARFMQRFTE